jgi:hypothetical protein
MEEENTKNDDNKDSKDNKDNKDKLEKQPEKTTKSVKDELISNIKEWIKLDNEITKMKQEIKEKNTKKKELSERLIGVMKNNSIDCFDINDGSLVYKQRKTKKTISGKFLLEQLEQYYLDQPELAKEITKKVLDNRIEVTKDELKKITK